MKEFLKAYVQTFKDIVSNSSVSQHLFYPSFFIAFFLSDSL